jgi:outer membrane receptor protein involved in Fe transport
MTQFRLQGLYRTTAPRRAIFQFIGILLSVAISGTLPAQIFGTVIDDVTGDPLIAASVLVEGTTVGTVTDIEGNYRLNTVPEGTQTLQFSYIGYEAQNIPIDVVSGFRQELDVRLAPAGFTGETVIITAQRQGQNAAINQQVKANGIVNVVSQERIRELPDENAAESVGRLPGVNVSRSGGEGQRVNIRGLSPKFSSVALDGVRIPATGQGRSVFNLYTRAGGGSNPSVDDRSVDLSMISSEALSGIEVFKSLTPDQDADAIGGRVNFVSARAPSTPKYILNVLGGYNAYHESYNNFKGNLTFSRRLFKDKLGIIATGAYSTIDRSADSYNVGYVFQGESVLNNLSLNDNISQRQRINGSLGLDYDLGNGHNLFFSSLYGRTAIDNENRNVGFSIRTGGANIGGGTGQNNINLYNASLTGRHPFRLVNVNWKATFVQTTDNGGPGFGYGFGDPNPFNGAPIPQTDPFLANRLFRYDFIHLGGGGPGGGNTTESNDQNFIGQVDLQRDFRIPAVNVSGFIKIGGKGQFKDRFRRNSGSTIGIPNNAYYRAFVEAYPESPLIRITNGIGTIGVEPFLDQGIDLTDFFDGQFPIPIAVDPFRAEQLFRQFEDVRLPNIRQDPSDYDATERIYATYLMGSLNIGDRLNIVGGLRYEYTDNEYGAIQRFDYREFVQNEEVRPSGQIEYKRSTQTIGELFPQVNVKYQLIKDENSSNGLDIRLAATRAITRPDFYNLTPYVTINSSSNSLERSDPELLPTTAWNYDAFLTLYSGKFGLFSVGGFYKELENVELLYGRTVPPAVVQERFGDEFGLGRISYNVVEPINAETTTYVTGGELEVQANFGWLPSPFDGLILYGNVSSINSEAGYPVVRREIDPVTFRTTFIDTTREGTLPGQAALLGNLSLGYDKGRFSGRISYNYQGDNLTFVGGNEELDGYVDTYVRVDFSATFKVTDQLSIQTNVNNILNRFDNRFIGFDRKPGGADIFGTVAWLGLRWTASGRKDE